ncbi:MAG: type III-B CRISPR module RAMP protein Cmr4 [Candidatus Brocadia sp.]|nr:type III-B CRISPR module RAMP protein Cmr4 [Candidatus Brocadia sp.]UJS16951.1 MAG: type III-B CRISPR module RAMP protein Cmr4 [Candidatus Jettenia sp.]
MFKEASLMFIYTETSLHAGSGTSLGVIDLPIQREKYTDYPVLQASGIKGAVRDWFETNNGVENQKIDLIFGPDTIGRGGEAFAGAATFTDARLLLFPVRSMKGVFAYTTSCFALNRLKRDLTMAKVANVNWNIPQEPQDNQVFGIKGSSLCEDGKVLLEEYAFDFHENNNDVKTIAEWLANNAFPNEYQFWKEKIKTDLLILPEDAFKDFVKLSTEVQARIKINNDTKTATSGALFYEETLTSDTLLYSIVMANDPFKDEANRPNGLKNAKDIMTFISALNGNRAQFGGDTTIGRGIVNIRLLNGGSK